ncbi:MAG: molecular chaperone DjiA [Pseudomonadota bacterium]
MSIWTLIAEAIGRLTGSGQTGGSLSDLFRTERPERSVAFAVAVIALGAKIAKADGRVTRDEIDAFKEVFTIPPGEEAKAARVFDYARSDVSGFQGYARQIRAMYDDADGRATREDILDGLFHIAGADGEYAEAELDFLAEVAAIFEIDERCFERLRARHDPSRGDPYALIGVAPDAPLEEIDQARKAILRESHPDRLHARGVPQEAVLIATKRVAAVNDAWARIKSERGTS